MKQSPEMEPNICDQLFLNEKAKVIPQSKGSFSNGARIIEYMYGKKVNLYSYLIPYIKSQNRS